MSHLQSRKQLISTFLSTGEEDQLSPLSNVHMIDVRAWLPGVKTTNGHLRVWLKRYGTSQVRILSSELNKTTEKYDSSYDLQLGSSCCSSGL